MKVEDFDYDLNENLIIDVDEIATKLSENNYQYLNKIYLLFKQEKN